MRLISWFIMMLWQVFADEWVMNLWKRLFGKSDDEIAPLFDRECEQLFLQLLQGVAANWDGERLGQVVKGDDGRMVVWLQGYGDRLLKEPANHDLAGLLVRLGEMGFGELGVVAQGIGLEMANSQVEPVPIEVEPQQVSEDQNDEAEMLFYKGVEAYQAARYQEALKYCNSAISIKPDDYAAWSYKGSSLTNLGRYKEAIAAYNSAISIKPDDYAAWSNKGFSLANLGRYEESIAAYDRAISINPNDYQAWSNKVSPLTDLGRYEEAITACDHAISINSNNYQAWSNKVSPLANLGRYEEAIVACDRAISINPNDHVAWSNKGNFQCDLGRYEESMAAYNRAIDIKPDYYVAWVSKGACLCDNLGRYEESIAAFDRVISFTKGNFWQAWINRGIAASKNDSKGKDTLLKLFGQYLPLEMQNSALDLRGYEGQLACYHEGLKYVSQSDELEGWGRLHRSIGNAH